MTQRFFSLEYFVNKFEAVPDELWWTGTYFNEDRTKRCALGWCFEVDPKNSRRLEMGDEFARLENLMRTYLDKGTDPINDGKVKQFNQPTPKQRVLAALKECIRIRDKK
jgi:hypothetical protein